MNLLPKNLCVRLISTLAFVLFAFLGKAQLSGTYTIGGTSPSYANFTAAVGALTTSGVSGAVTFRVRQGTYNEQITIGNITGASASNTITFEPDPNNSQGVTLQYTGTTTSNNFVVRLNAAKYINFKNLTIKANGSSYGRVFFIYGLSQNITIDSCNVEANTTTATSSSVMATIYEESGSSNRLSDFTVSNSIIKGGAYGVLSYGYSTGVNFQRNWTIENNTIEDFYYSGVFLQNYYDTLSIAGNTFTQRTNATTNSSYGIYSYRAYRPQIEKNVVIMRSRSAYGIYAFQNYGASNRRSRMANNMVSVLNPSTVSSRYGIYVIQSSYLDVVYNSVYHETGGGQAMYAHGSNCVFRNNALATYSTLSNAVALNLSGNYTRSNNCVWAPNGASSNNQSLGTGSKNQNPSFNSPTDLHTSSIHLNNSGVSVAGVSTDIDGQTRSTSAPDIGADEFTPPPNDAGIESVVNPTVCAGSNPIRVKLKNYGSNTLSSATINWTVRLGTGTPASQTPFSFSGSIGSGNDSVLTIGNFSFVSGNTYTIRVWTTSPNSSSDGNNSNDTASKTISPSLSGVYTIGGTSPDYATIQAAATDMKNKGVCGPVDFRIRPGNYFQSVTIDSCLGLSSTNTVTFRKDPTQSGNVRWYHNSRPLTFQWAKHVIIRDLTLESTGLNVVLFQNQNDHITLKNNIIRGRLNSGTSASYTCIYAPRNSTYQVNDIVIDSNEFRRGTAAVYMSGWNTSLRAKRNQITNNNYDSAGYYGFYFEYQDTMLFRNNSLRDNGSYSNRFALYLNYCYDFDVQSNAFYQYKYNGAYGFQIIGGGGTSSNHSKVINNYSYTSSGQYGIYTSSVNYTDFFFNTVRLEGNNTNSYAAYFNYGFSYLRNNNFSNEAGGYVMYARNTSSVPLSDYNNLYTTSTTRFSYYGGWRTTFALHKSGSGRDANSKSVFPFWRSSDGPLPNNGQLNGAGNAITGVSTDINGSTRTSPPDIGCVEFTPSINDAGVDSIHVSSVCPGSSPVRVQLANYGGNTLTQARIQWTVKTNTGTPVAQTAYNWTGSLSAYTDTTVTLGNFTFVGTNNYVITAYTDQANNTTDPVRTNDTAQTPSLSPSMKGTYTVGGSSPDYTNLQTALNALNQNGVCGHVTLNVRGGSYYGRFSFGSVPGAGPGASITVQTDPSSTSTAELYYPSYPVLINAGASYYTLKNMKFRITGSSSVVYFNGNNDHITFENDSLIGATTTSGSFSYSVFYDNSSSSLKTSYLTIKDCDIFNGSVSVYLHGQNATTNAQFGNVIKDNKMYDFSYMGVYALYNPTLIIEGNELHERRTRTNAYAIRCEWNDSITIRNNNAQMGNGYGILAMRCYGNSGRLGLDLYNNMISFDDTSSTVTSYGIYLDYVYYGRVVYNSVNLSKGSTNAAAIFTRFGSNTDILNNNFINEGPGYAQQHSWVSSIGQLDYNNMKSGGTNIGNYNGNRTTLAAWKTATGTGKSNNTISVDPLYVSINDLHAQNTAINNQGTPVSGITTDFDGDTRSTTAPDIGADEFTIYASDAGIANINSSVCVGTNPIEINLRNYGTGTLTSTTIRWRVKTNSGAFVNQTAFSFNGSLVGGRDTTFSIGNFNFIAGNTYTIQANTDGFNSGTDQNRSNDTAITLPNAPRMSGTYIVGTGTGTNWRTIDSAVTALETVGVCGPTTIFVRNGSYNEAVQFTSIPGASASNYVTIQGDSTGAYPDWYNSGVPLTLTAVKYVSFRHLKIRTTATRAVDFVHGNEFIAFESDTLEGRNINNSGNTYAVMYNRPTSNNQNHHCSFINNHVKNGSYGFYWEGFSSGPNSERGHVFRGNQIVGCYAVGIQVTNQDTLEIKDNYIRTRWTHNRAYGILIQNARTFSIISNKVEVINGRYGIYVSNASGYSNSQRLPIQNNFVVLGGTIDGVGIFSTNSVNLNYYHNSVHTYNTNTSTYAFYQGSGSGVHVRNNSFYNSGGGNAIRINNPSQYLGNHNNLYSSGSSLGYYNGNRSSLSQWRSATGDDANSISVNPMYVDTFDLHSTSAQMNNAGNPVGVFTDIDGDPRSTTTPDIGADEFSATPNDLALVDLLRNNCPGTQAVQARLRNTGTATIQRARLRWQISTNGATPVAQPDFVLTDSIQSLNDTVVTLGSLTYNPTNFYGITVWVDSVNSVLDQNNLNDTLDVDSIYSAMSGLYTIGGSSPDFATFTSAVRELEDRGVCGPVDFQVRPGSYTDRIRLTDSIAGASSVNTVTFRTDTNFTSRATLRSSGRVVDLWNVKHLRVENMVLEMTGTTNTIWCNGDIQDLQFENNLILGSTTTSTSPNYACAYIYAGTANVAQAVNFVDNEIRRGSSGLYYLGTVGGRMKNALISGNDIRNFCHYGIYTHYSDSLTIIDNHIGQNRIGGFSPQGISVNQSFGFEISANTIQVGTTSNVNKYGIRLYQADGANSSTPGRVFNNMISVRGNSSQYTVGLDLVTVEYVDISYNSVNVYGFGSNTHAINISSGNNHRLRNNVLANQAGGRSITTNRNLALSDHNDLYTSGSVLCYYAGNRNNLAAWRSYTSDDQNSISVAPVFTNDTNLHTFNSSLNGAGIPVPGITDDIDGDPRSSTSPDIGADEFSPVAFDGALSTVDAIYCPGGNNLTMELTNRGSQTITSAQVKWYVKTNNGGFVPQGSASFTGSVSSGNSAIVNLGSFSLGTGNTYQIMGVVDSINGNPDGNSLNDTAITNDISPALTGTYTVGQNGDFSTIQQADSMLEKFGVCGPVSLDLLQGTFNESVIFETYKGMSATNSITIKADTSNTGAVNWTTTQTPILLDSAHHFIIEGLNLTSTGAGVIYMSDNCSDITIRENVLTGVYTYSLSLNNIIIRYDQQSNNTSLNNITIEDNEIVNGSYSLYIPGTSSAGHSGLVFNNNDVRNYRYMGVYLYYTDSVEIIGNEFKNSTNGGTYGIQMLYSDQFRIEKNKIDNTALNSTASIYVGWSSGTSTNRSVIGNNFFASRTNSGIRGVDLRNNNYVNFYYNSIQVVGNSTNSYALYAGNGSNNSYINNNVINLAGGYAIYVTGNNEYAAGNYNNLYSSSSSILGYWKGSFYNTLTAWRTASSRDMNSVSGDPFYKGIGDLHALGTPSHNAGTAIAGYTEDIDGEARSASSPDIGADEFTASPNDAGLDSLTNALFCEGTNSVFVKLTNYGTDTLKSVTINWSISEDFATASAQSPYSWTGSLPTGQSAMVNIGNFFTSADTSYQVYARTSSPNNTTDGFAGNDSAQNMSRKPAMSGIYVIAQAGTRDFSSITAAASELMTRGVCGPVTFSIKSGNYTGPVNINEIEGASSINRVSFEADTSNTAPVVVNSSGYTFNLSGTDHLFIKGLDIRSSRRAAIYATGSVSHLRVMDNHITNSNNSYYYYNYYYNSAICIYNTSNQPSRNMVISGNTIKGGAYGIYYHSSGMANNDDISENFITNFRNIGLYVRNNYDLNIEGNSIIDSTFNRGNGGIHTVNCAVDLISNRVVVHGYSSSTAVRLDQSRDTSGTTKLIYNNAISHIQNGNGVGTAIGLYLYFCDNQNIYHNSILMEGGNNASSRALFMHSGSNTALRNNSLVNKSGGYAIHSSTFSQITSSNYNNLWTTGSQLGYRSGSNYATLANWRSGTNFDANSTSANANYLSAFELRPNHIALDGRATSLTGFSNDIEGVNRGTSPDIGAYQFTTRADDAGIVTLKSQQLCNGTQNVVLALKNFGGDTLKSAIVHWAVSRNGGAFVAQSNYSWNGVMPPGEVDSNVQVGSFNFTGGDYQILSFTSNPNSKTDELFANDTLLDDLYIKLRGNYTLGDTASDFPSWASFERAINRAGVCGAVTVRAKPGTYFENLTLNAVTGLSASDDLTIVSDTGSGMAELVDSNTTLSLINMAYVNIEGLSIKASGSESAIRLEGYNHDINIDSCYIEGPSVLSSTANESAIYVNSNLINKSNDLSFNGNEITKGSNGVYMAGGSNNREIDDIHFYGNEITDFYQDGIYAYYTDNLDIEGNRIASSSGASSNGLNLTYCDRFNIEKNRIEITSSSSGQGIALNRVSGQSSGIPAIVVNNFIQAAGGTGINLRYGTYVNFYYNSVHINPNTQSYSAGSAVRLFSNSQVYFYNNSFANMANGTVFDRYSNEILNNNNLYTTGLLFSWNNIQNLSDWRTTTNQDAQSVSADPIYLSATDLHANQTLMDSSGLIITNYNTDIDGDPRDPSFPDMGADEFDLIFNVGIEDVLQPESYRARKFTSTQFSNAEDIEVVVRNFGPPVTDIPVEMQFNSFIYRDTIFGTLNAGQRDTFKFSSQVNLDIPGTNVLRVFTAMPNDQFIENDTLDIDIVTLENDPVKLPYAQDFENIKDTAIFENFLGIWDIEEFDFVTDGGRLQTRSGKKVGGEQAITLDRNPNGPIKKNELILTLNMNRYDMTDSVYLSFDYIDHRDERHKGDSVWVRGSDTSAWVGIYDLWKNRRTNRVKEVIDLDVTSALAAAGQSYTSSFQVKFGQEDNQRLPGDGRTFDNIELRAVLPFDLALEDAQIEYRQVPVDMANNRLNGRVINKGYQTLTNTEMRVNVLGRMANVAAGTLMRDQDSSLTTTDSLGNLNAGVYQGHLYSWFSGTDKCPENDSASINFSLTDTVLARDNNAVDSTFGFSGSGGQMGTVLEVFKADTLTSISFYLNVPTIGDTLKAHVYSFNQGSVGSRVTSAEPIVVTSNASRWYHLPITCLEFLQPGKYLVAVEQNSANNLTLGITEDNYMMGASWINSGSGWNAFEDSLGGYLFNIHANFGAYDLPIITAPKGLCINSQPIVIRANIKGGAFAGKGIVNDSIFDPSVAGYGNHMVTYGIQNSKGCNDTNGVVILVDSLPNVTLPNQAAACVNGGNVLLLGGQPAGGMYSGTGVVGPRLDPTVVGVGTHTISYQYTKPVSGCTDSASATIRIKPKPNVTLSNIPDFCVNDSAMTLTQGTPSGGTYSGQGVTAGKFDPQTSGLGSKTINYVFVDTNACQDVKSQTIMVNDTPSVNLGPDKQGCPKQLVTLDAGNSGSTYNWSDGSGSQTLVVSTTGTYTVTVTDANGCSNSDNVLVTIDAECLSVDEAGLAKRIKYFPNPNSGRFMLRLIGVSNGEVQLDIRNLQGQVVRSYHWENDSRELTQEIDLVGEATGVYMLLLQTPDGSAVHRVTVR